ncbi:hypothetical protein PS684_06198 [Pseudomonas fluorescens]|nr:hypothetical protein PS684_06198 [Pseudomonas fluorescens]
MGRDISFACHCKSVIGFGSPLRYRRMAPPYAVSFCGCVLYGGHAWGSFMSAGFPYRPVYQPAHGRHPPFGSEGDGSHFFKLELYLCSKSRQIHRPPTQSLTTPRLTRKRSKRQPTAPSTTTCDPKHWGLHQARPRFARSIWSTPRWMKKPCWSKPVSRFPTPTPWPVTSPTQ